MQRACVSLTYEVVLSIPDKGDEEVRIPAVSIFNIKDGKVGVMRCNAGVGATVRLKPHPSCAQLVSGIAVLDAHEVHASGPSLSCTIS